MNLPYFISNRISRESSGTFSQSINRVAVISISVGILALLLSFMILGGFRQKIQEKIYSFSGNLLITKYSLSSSFEENMITLGDTLLNALHEDENVSRWQYYAYKAGLLKTEEEVQGVIFKGVDASFDTAYFKENLIEGLLPELTNPESLSDNSYSTSVAVSSKVARYLNLNVGDKVLIFFVQNPPRYRNLTISGIYETGLEEFDEKIIIGDLNLVRRINGWDEKKVGGVEVFLNNGVDSYEAQEKLFKNIGFDLYVDNVKDKYMQIFDWLSLLNRNVLVLLILILVVACFSMISIVLILIMERTQMIGMLKAMGGTNKLIRQVFLGIGVRLIFRGLFWGNLIALSIGIIQYYFHIIPLDPVNYYMSFVPVEFDPVIIIGLNLLTILIIGLSLYIPVTIISKVKPIKSIRFD